MPRRLLVVLSLLALLVSFGCKGAASAVETKSGVDGDPLALLPGSAIVFASVDARAMYASVPVGATIASFTDSFVPLTDAAGFQASRDVDRIVVGSYVANEADVAVVLNGRFDVDKIAAATTTKGGAAVVRGTYAGFATSTAGGVTVAPLTPRTLVAGTNDRVRRVLDRVQKGDLARAMPPWAAATLDTPGAQFAIAGDFSTQQIASATIGSVSLAWLKGLRVLRVIGDFDAPGVNAAATLTYGDASGAESAADGMRLIGGWQTLLAPLLFGAKLQNLQVSTTGSDASCKFAVDDASLHAILTLAGRYLRPPSP
jgi:hypothetical protein